MEEVHQVVESAGSGLVWGGPRLMGTKRSSISTTGGGRMDRMSIHQVEGRPGDYHPGAAVDRGFFYEVSAVEEQVAWRVGVLSPGRHPPGGDHPGL